MVSIGRKWLLQESGGGWFLYGRKRLPQESGGGWFPYGRKRLPQESGVEGFLSDKKLPSPEVNVFAIWKTVTP